MSDEYHPKTNSPRNPFIAFLLGILVTGLGQIYNGQLKRGILFFLVTLVLPVIMGYFRLGTFFIGFIAIGIIDIAFKIYTVYLSTKKAKKSKVYSLQTYNRWYYYIMLTIGAFALQWFLNDNSVLGVQVFKIPNTSNEPTVKTGDRVVVDLQAYKNGEPNYGDLAVFKKRDSVNPWIYRIVALPYDTIFIENNTLTINGKNCPTTFIGEATSEAYPVNEFEEVLPNGHKHRMYTFRTDLSTKSANTTPIIVPENSYFLMADHRDNGYDSRYIGVIHSDELIGKIIFGFWGKSSDRIHVNFADR